MRFALVVLCSVFLQGVDVDYSFAQNATAPTSVHVVATDLPANEFVRIEKMEWRYLRQDDKNASAEITVNNLSDKKIKRIRFSVIANDQAGLALESEGFSIKKLESTEELEPNASKTYRFDKAFINERVAELGLSNAMIEYENGSIDIIKNEQDFSVH